MENNWPETIEELLAECQMLVSKTDLYELGERGEPFTGEAEPRVDGTDYLAGEYQYGVAMIPAQWVTHVIDAATLGSGTLTAEQVRETVDKHWHDLSTDYDMPEATALPEYSYDWQAMADELNATLGSGTCKWQPADFITEGDWWNTECGESFTWEPYGVPNYCPNCGRAVE